MIVVSSVCSAGAWAAEAASGTRAPVATSKAKGDFIGKDSMPREGILYQGDAGRDTCLPDLLAASGLSRLLWGAESRKVKMKRDVNNS